MRCLEACPGPLRGISVHRLHRVTTTAVSASPNPSPHKFGHSNTAPREGGIGSTERTFTFLGPGAAWLEPYEWQAAAAFYLPGREAGLIRDARRDGVGV